MEEPIILTIKVDGKELTVETPYDSDMDDLTQIFHVMSRFAGLEFESTFEKAYKSWNSGVSDDDILAEAQNRYANEVKNYIRMEDNAPLRLAFQQGARWARAKLNEI